LTVSHDNEYVFYELLKYLWKKKIAICSIVFSVALLTVIWVINIPNQYQSSALVSPTESAKGNGLSSMGAQLGGLASLAGINLSGGSADKVSIALQVISSRQFILEFIERYDIAVPLIASASWDKINENLVIDKDIYDVESKAWTRKNSDNEVYEPTTVELYNTFIDLMTIEQDATSGMVTISIEHISPQLAQKWTGLLVEELNKIMRVRDISATEKSISFLYKQIDNTTNFEMQKMFYELIQEQTKTLMIAEVTPEYIFEVIDPAYLPLDKSSPKRALIVIAAAILTGMLTLFGFILVFLVFPKEK